MDLETIYKTKYKKYNGGKDELGYLKYYDAHLPKKVDNFLEIGIGYGYSIRAFRDWYNLEGNFYAMNKYWGNQRGVIAIEALEAYNIKCFSGDQGDLNFLKTIKINFDVIVEDGSHHSDDQIVTFKQMFDNNVKSGGLYVLEDLHCCAEMYWWRGKINSFNDTMLSVLMRFNKKQPLTSQMFTKNESDYYHSLIDRVYLFHASGAFTEPSIAFIFKK